MARVRFLLCLLLLSSLSFAADGKIYGALVDDMGLPVPRMGVQAFPTDIGHSGGLPSATSDEHGRFVIRIPSVSERSGEHWAVYPYSADFQGGFYPRPNDFYQNNLPGPPIVELSPKVLEASVELKLGPPVAALIVNVASAHNSNLGQRSFHLAWVSDPSKERETTVYVEKGPFRLLIPANINIALTVTSPGFKPWKNAEVISVGSGQETRIDVTLEPE